MEASEKHKNHVRFQVRSQKLTLQQVMPEPTSRFFAGPEDQLRLHSTPYRKRICFAVCAVCAAPFWQGRVIMLDKIDIELLEQCKQNPGQPLINAIKPLLGSRKIRTLYDRMRALEAQQFVWVDRSQKKVYLATITEKGKAVIIGTGGTARPKADGDSQ